MPENATPPQMNTCLSCKRQEAPDVPGAIFHAQGDNGMVADLWLCNACAVKLGPGQGPIDMRDPTLAT